MYNRYKRQTLKPFFKMAELINTLVETEGFTKNSFLLFSTPTTTKWPNATFLPTITEQLQGLFPNYEQLCQEYDEKYGNLCNTIMDEINSLFYLYERKKHMNVRELLTTFLPFYTQYLHQLIVNSQKQNYVLHHLFVEQVAESNNLLIQILNKERETKEKIGEIQQYINQLF